MLYFEDNNKQMSRSERVVFYLVWIAAVGFSWLIVYLLWRLLKAVFFNA